MTTEILFNFLQSLDGSLVDARFLRFDELSNLRLMDVTAHPTYLFLAIY